MNGIAVINAPDGRPSVLTIDLNNHDPAVKGHFPILSYELPKKGNSLNYHFADGKKGDSPLLPGA